jgi:GNAT superfamily N-acetyltransferase
MIREATLEDGPRLFEMACHFMAATRYGELFSPNHPALAQLVALVLEKGIVFVDEQEHTNDCATWYDAMVPGVTHDIDGDRWQPAPACNCGRRIIGMLGLIVAPNILTGQHYADEIAWWVDPEHRKSRAAHRLLCAAENWARQKGLSVLKMVAPAGSEIGTFYERRGYVLVESAYQKVLQT